MPTGDVDSKIIKSPFFKTPPTSFIAFLIKLRSGSGLSCLFFFLKNGVGTAIINTSDDSISFEAKNLPEFTHFVISLSSPGSAKLVSLLLMDF